MDMGTQAMVTVMVMGMVVMGMGIIRLMIQKIVGRMGGEVFDGLKEFSGKGVVKNLEVRV